MALYAGVAALSILMLFWHMDLAGAHLKVPFYYVGSDPMLNGFAIKTIIDYGSVLYNPAVGAPFGLDFRAFPLPDLLHLLIVRGMSFFTHDWALILNLYYLLGFPLSALSALFLMRRFSVSAPASATAAILFAFLPSHFLRGEGHLWLASYYIVPLTTFVILWLGCGYPLTARLRFLAGVICILSGLAGVYYAFFGAGLLLVAGVQGSLRRHSFRPLLAATACAALVSAAVVIALSPNIVFLLQHGANAIHSAVFRPPSSAEVYGLRMAQMLLPPSYHRLGLMAHIRKIYDTTELTIANESAYAALGSIADLGFVAIIVCLVFGLRRDPLWDSLSMLTITALLIGTIGGLSAGLIYIFPEIRAYNRISIYIAICALLAAALLWDRAVAGLTRPALRRAAPWLLAPILVAGFLDQSPPGSWYPSRSKAIAQYASDQEFVDEIERRLSPGAMIFEFPYVPFPESPPMNQMEDYELFRGYLHSRDLRWSYGSIRGSAGDAWEQSVTAQPIPSAIQELARRGFSGIYVDRFGYPPHEYVLIEDLLTAALGPPAIVSPNHRLAFYLLPPANGNEHAPH